jgi:hypothetical protein
MLFACLGVLGVSVVQSQSAKAGDLMSDARRARPHYRARASAASMPRRKGPASIGLVQ